MYCKYCGTKNKEGAIFCKSCGKDITPKSKIPSESQPLQPQEAVAQLGNPNKKSTSRKTIIAAVVILVIIFVLPATINYFSKKNSGTSGASNINTQSVVNVLCDNGQGGSGTIFTTDGTVLTNNHVITGSTQCQITIPDPASGQPAEIYNAAPVITPTLSEKYDVATLKIDGAYTDKNGKTYGDYPTTFPEFVLPSTCSTSTQSQLNDSVRIYGYPDTSGGYNLTVTDGIISSFADDGSILTSAKVDSGNSGGLAIDQNGCWLGIPSAVVSGNYQNLGVIIPGSVVENFLSGVPAKAEPIAASPSTDTLSAPTTGSQESNDQKCQDSYGTYSEWTGSTDSNGQPKCACQTGYSWNGTGDACATQLSLQQQCQNQFGIGSYSYTQGGKAVCGCSTGYNWNSDQTACVATLTPDEICQRDVGQGSSYLGYKNSDGTYACSSPSQ